MPASLPRSIRRLAQPASLPRAILAAAALVLLTLGVVTHFALKAAHLQVVSRALDEGDRNAEKLALHAREVLDHVNQTLLLAKSLHESHNSLTLRSLRHAGLGASDATRAVFLTDRSGRVEDSSTADVVLHIGDDDAFKALARLDNDPGLVIGTPVRDELGGGSVIPVMRRLADTGGVFDGAVVAWVEPAVLTRGFGRADLPGMTVNVAGLDGIVRSRVSDEQLSFGQAINVDRLFREVKRTRGSLEPTVTPIDGKARFMTYATVERYPLVAIAAFSADAVLGAYAAERRHILSWAATAALLTLIGTGLLLGQARQLVSSRADARRAHALYQATLEGGLDALWLLEAVRDATGAAVDFRITEANARAAAMVGSTREVLGGMLVTQMLPTSGHDGLLRSFLRVLATQVTREFEARGAVATVRGRWLHYQIVPAANGVSVVVRDIDDRKRAERQLAERESFLRALLDALPVAVYSKSARPETLGQVQFWNRAAEAQYGLKAEHMIGRSSHDYLPATLADAAIAQDREVVRTGASMTFTDLRYEVGSDMRLLNFVKAPVRGADGDIDHVIVIAEDITQRRAAAAQLELISRVVQETGDAVVLSDAADCIVLANAAFASMTGWSAGAVLGRPACDFGLPALDDETLSGVEEALRSQHRWTGEGQQGAADGSRFDIGLNVTVIRDAAGVLTHHARLFSDISQRKAQERLLAEMARMDALTRLANRRHFEEQLVLALARAQRSGEPLALLFIDLDGFKAVNDSLGHDAGDQLLISVAQRLRANVRTTDLVSRLGGDEFTVILENAGSAADQRAHGERLLAALSQPHLLGGRSVISTPSMGLAVYRPDESLGELRQRADAAMYQAKRAGKGRLRVDRSPTALTAPVAASPLAL